MLECECGTVAVPMGQGFPRGWTLREGKNLCPLCTRVEQEKRRRQSALN